MSEASGTTCHIGSEEWSSEISQLHTYNILLRVSPKDSCTCTSGPCFDMHGVFLSLSTVVTALWSVQCIILTVLPKDSAPVLFAIIEHRLSLSLSLSLSLHPPFKLIISISLGIVMKYLSHSVSWIQPPLVCILVLHSLSMPSVARLSMRDVWNIFLTVLTKDSTCDYSIADTLKHQKIVLTP